MDENIIKAICSVIIIVIPALAFGLMGQPTEMGFAIIAGAIGACFLNLDKVQRFRGAGFEAEMQKAVQEAYATIDSLKEVTKPLLLSTLQVLTSSGRLSGLDPQEKHKIKDELDNICLSLSISDVDIKHAGERFHRYHAWDHYNSFVEALSKETKVAKDKVNQLRSLKDYSSIKYPTEGDILRIIEINIEELDPEIHEKFKNYLYYIKHNQLRTLGPIL